MPQQHLTSNAIFHAAAGLMSDDGENTEYDRAIVELTGTLLGIDLNDDRDQLEADLRASEAPKPPIYSSCRVNGRTSVYTYWTNDSDYMVRVNVDMSWPPAGGTRVQSAEERRDRGDEPFRPVKIPAELVASSARDVATFLIREAARG